MKRFTLHEVGESFGLPHSGDWAFGDLDQRVCAWDGDGDGVPKIDMGAFEFGDPPFIGDLDGDAIVDPDDLFMSQGQWQSATSSSTVFGDQNGDKAFDQNDLLILRNAWGREYE